MMLESEMETHHDDGYRPALIANAFLTLCRALELLPPF
jgi:hypothetical protein